LPLKQGELILPVVAQYWEDESRKRKRSEVMAAPEIESRVTALEAKVEELQRHLKAVAPDTRPWWENVVGVFADDPAFEEAMRLGREYRESLRPRQATRTKSVKAKER
jgi:hypothetical protein